MIETDEMCKPTKMMHLQESEGEWCSDQSDLGIESGRSFNGEAGGYYLPGNYSDGQDNWLNIQIAIPDGDVPGYYPIFQWADSLSEYGGGWYIPAVRELYSIYQHKFEINETLNTMQSNYPNLSIDLLKTEYGYWTSCGT